MLVDVVPVDCVDVAAKGKHDDADQPWCPDPAMVITKAQTNAAAGNDQDVDAESGVIPVERAVLNEAYVANGSEGAAVGGADLGGEELTQQHRRSLGYGR